MSESHGTLFATGLIDGEDYFQGAIAFLAVDGRLAIVPNGVCEIEELAFESGDGDGHGIRRAGSDIVRQGSGIGGIGLSVIQHVPGSQAITGDNGRAFNAVNFDALGIARPKGGRGLNHACGAGFVREQSVDDVFGLDAMPCAKLPVTTYARDGTHQMQQNVHLMNSLIDERPAAFGMPTALDGP